MADTHRERRTYKVYIFNCDGTCNLDEVTSLLKAVEEKADIEIKVEKYPYELNETTIVEAEIRSGLEMDIAVLMLHAQDICPSFDDNRHGRIYNALKDKTGSAEKVLIVIGGDEKYESKQEEEEKFISKYALKKNGLPHLLTECLDGRKSFMFSWNKKHRPIHKEAMMHFLDPCKRGQEFVRQVTPNVPSNQTEGAYLIPVDNEDETQGNESERYEIVDTPDSTSTQGRSRTPLKTQVYRNKASELTELSRTTRPRGTVLLSTIMQNGAISYSSEDVRVWKDGRKWRVSANEARRLQEEWGSIPTARLKLVADDEGKVQLIVKVETTFFQRVWHALSRFRRR